MIRFIFLAFSLVVVSTIGDFKVSPPYSTLAQDFMLGGSATFTRDYIQLTSEAQNQLGYIWSKNPVDLGKEWTITIETRISGSNPNIYGDGIAIVLSDQPFKQGAFHGISPIFNGVAVVLDTFDNGNIPGASYPYLYALSADGKNPVDSESYPHRSKGCKTDFRYKDVGTKQSYLVQISFSSGILSVQVLSDKGGSIIPCTMLTDPNIKQDEMYVGISSSTGRFFDSHKIISISHINSLKTADRFRMASNQEATSSFMQKPSTVNDETFSLLKDLDSRIITVNALVEAFGQHTSQESELKKYVEQFDARMKKFQYGLEDHVSKINTDLRSILGKLEEQNIEFEKRLEVLESKLNIKVSKAANSWFFPFMILGIVLIIAGIYIYKKIMIVSSKWSL